MNKKFTGVYVGEGGQSFIMPGSVIPARMSTFMTQETSFRFAGGVIMTSTSYLKTNGIATYRQ